MPEKHPEPNSASNTTTEPNSHSRLGFFVFFLGLVLVLLGGTIYAWQNESLESLKTANSDQVESSNQDPQKSETKQPPFPGWNIQKYEHFGFAYPDQIDSNFIQISSQEWPPQVIIKEAKTKKLRCEPGEEKLSLSGDQFCFNKSIEGTAGTTYKRYSYRSIISDSRISIIFYLAFPSCGAMTKVQQCRKAKSDFNVHDLTEKIYNSISINN